MVPERLVLVCTGNTCRSPLAAVIAASVLSAHGLHIAVASAGLVARPGEPAAAEARAVAADLGLSLEAHSARSVRDIQDGPGTLWLTMTPAQADELCLVLGVDDRVQPLLAMARAFGAPAVDGDEVPDPFRRDRAAYDAVATTLRVALTALADGWAQARHRDVPGQARVKTLALPRLGGLAPTLESTALKLLEEAGELAEVIGKYRALSGERRPNPEVEVMTSIGRELLDVAQTAITMMFVLEEQHGVDLQGLLHQHVDKLAAKGYLEPALRPPGDSGPSLSR